MIWFSNPGGRTGNLLFQYAFLESIRRPEEIILTTNLGSFPRQFKLSLGYHSVDVKWPMRFLEKIVDPILYHLLVKTRVVSSWVEWDNQVRVTRGVIPGLKFVKGYFQNSRSWVSSAAPMPTFRKTDRDRAEHLISTLPSGRPRVFLHVRRGDYLSWNVLGKKDPTLPMDYYRVAVNRVQRDLVNPFFLILSDEPHWVQENFRWLGDFYVSREKPAVDLILMSRCQWGVLSNSTLAWWGGNAMVERRGALVPEFWLGFQSGVEYPKGIIPSWATQVPSSEWFLP